MNTMRMRMFARGALIACACAASMQGRAAPVAWASDRLVYRAQGASLVEALTEFAAGQRIPVRIEAGVRGVVNGRFAMPPQRFLDTLARSYGFVWYFDGAVLHVSPANEQQRIAIRPHVLGPGALRASLERAGVTDEHFPLVVDTAAQTIDVRGPATYVTRIRAAAERFEGDANKRERSAVRVFRLTVANAADETRVIDGRTIVVPGAATLLRHRFEQRVAAPASDAGDAPQVVELDTALPVIEADAVTNSILIRDRAERIDADGVLVADLDVRAQLVSVQTWVVDVDAAAFDALAPVLPPAMTVAAGAPAEAGADEPAHAGIAPDGGRALLAQLEALVKRGRAGIEVSQTALTQDRTPAVVDRHEAQLALHRDEGGIDEAPSADLWLSVEPTVDGAASTTRRIGLHVELGRRDDARRYRSIDDSVAPGECLVIEGAPRQGRAEGDAGDEGDPSVRRRLVLLIPRIAA